jgi:hypothetical protein
MKAGTAARLASGRGAGQDPHRSLHSETGALPGEHPGRSKDPLIKAAGRPLMATCPGLTHPRSEKSCPLPVTSSPTGQPRWTHCSLTPHRARSAGSLGVAVFYLKEDHHNERP